MISFWSLALFPLIGAGPIDPSVTTPSNAVVSLPKGILVIEGGGKASPAVRKKALSLAGGPKARVVVVPQASNAPNNGPLSAARWREFGAEYVEVLDLADPASAVGMISRADLIWIAGGEQERLMGRLKGTGVPEAIRDRYRDGAVVGGTSAGAAVMSKVMIVKSQKDYPRTGCDQPILGEGLGLWSGVVVDQHFHKFKRLQRLKNAVGETSTAVGVGIDESTAVIVEGSGRSFEVVGEGRVVIVDPRAAEARVPVVMALSGGGDGAPPAEVAAGLRTSTLDPGMKYDLDKGIIPEPIAAKH